MQPLCLHPQLFGWVPLAPLRGGRAGAGMAPVGSRKQGREWGTRAICAAHRGLSLASSQQQQQWQQRWSFQARKEMRKGVATFSTLLLQAAAYVEFIESPSWLFCGGDVQQCLLPK